MRCGTVRYGAAPGGTGRCKASFVFVRVVQPYLHNRRQPPAGLMTTDSLAASRFKKGPLVRSFPAGFLSFLSSFCCSPFQHHFSVLVLFCSCLVAAAIGFPLGLAWCSRFTKPHFISSHFTYPASPVFTTHAIDNNIVARRLPSRDISSVLICFQQTTKTPRPTTHKQWHAPGAPCHATIPTPPPGRKPPKMPLTWSTTPTGSVNITLCTTALTQHSPTIVSARCAP